MKQSALMGLTSGPLPMWAAGPGQSQLILCPGPSQHTQPAEGERRQWWPRRPMTLTELQVAARQAGGLWCWPPVILLEWILPLIWPAMVGRGARCPRCSRGWSASWNSAGGTPTPQFNKASVPQPNWNACLMADGHGRAGGSRGVKRLISTATSTAALLFYLILILHRYWRCLWASVLKKKMGNKFALNIEM